MAYTCHRANKNYYIMTYTCHRESKTLFYLLLKRVTERVKHYFNYDLYVSQSEENTILIMTYTCHRASQTLI